MSISKSLRIAGSLVVISLAPMFIGQAAAEEVAVLVVSEESSRDAESRRSPVFRTALIAVAQAMLRRKLTPKGAEEVLPKGSYQTKGRNTMKVWLRAAERAEPKVQFAVGLRLVASVIDRPQSRLVEVKLSADSRAVPSGDQVGYFEMDKPRRYALPADCDRKCVVKVATDAVKEVASEAGAASASSIDRAR